MFDAYFINYLPSYLRWQDVLTIVSLSLVLSFLATIYPAMRAANSNLRRHYAMSKIVLEAQNIEKHFTDGKSTVEVIKGLSLQVKAGEFVSIVGSSGSGKSTLLHVLGGLDRPSSGQVFLQGSRFDSLNEAERGYLRNRTLRFCLPVPSFVA